jgi:hypothetical protein
MRNSKIVLFFFMGAAILEAPGQAALGRFGWKDQDPTILSFAGRCLSERGRCHKPPEANRYNIGLQSDFRS